MQESPPHKRFILIVGRSPPYMRLARHLTARRAWCKQRLPGQWKHGVLRPGIVGMRGSMYDLMTTPMHGMSTLYGHTTTAMHDIEYTPTRLRYILCIGWVGIVWQRYCRTCRSLLELDNQGTLFLFLFCFFGGRSPPVVE